MAPAGRVRESGRPAYQNVDLDAPGAVLQPQPHRLRRRRHGGERTPVRRRRSRTRARRAWRCRRSSAAWRSAWRSWTTTSSPRGRSTPTRRCCGCATSATASRSWHRSCPSTATRTRSSIDGTVQWVVDGYTSTSRYPYAEAVGDDVALSPDSGIPRDANYVRNSVKAVVDAYDGSVTMYVVDDEDPIVRAWMSAFPDLFSPGRRDARRAAGPPPLPRGPVPGADERVLQVPARPGPVLRARRSVVGGPGARRRPARDLARRHPAADAGAPPTSASRPWRPRRRTFASCPTTRCSARATSATSCCCARSCRSPATTSGASCRRS